jgi:hypothetical protein
MPLNFEHMVYLEGFVGQYYYHAILTPKRTKALFWPFFEVWAGHCGCNICSKNLKFLVNMWFSINFKVY